MHQETGPSNSSSSRQVGDSDDSADAKQRTIKITMGGGLRSAESMLSALIPEPALCVFLHLANLTFFTLPFAVTLTVLFGFFPLATSPLLRRFNPLRFVTSIVLRDVSQADKIDGPREEINDESEGQLPRPPKKRRRLSNHESDVTSPTVPLTENLLDLLDKFTSALLREFPSAPVPPEAHHPGESGAALVVGNDHELGSGGNVGSSTPHSSTTANGKPPMK